MASTDLGALREGMLSQNLTEQFYQSPQLVSFSPYTARSRSSCRALKVKGLDLGFKI